MSKQSRGVWSGIHKKSRLTTPQGKFKWYLTEKLSKNSFSKKKVTFANWVSAEKHLNVNLRLCDN